MREECGIESISRFMKTKRKSWNRHIDNLSRKDYRKIAGTINHTTKDGKEDHLNDKERVSKQLLQKPNKGILLVNG